MQAASREVSCQATCTRLHALCKMCLCSQDRPVQNGPLTAAVDSADVKHSTWCSCLTLAVLQLSGQKQKPGSWCPALALPLSHDVGTMVSGP